MRNVLNLKKNHVSDFSDFHFSSYGHFCSQTMVNFRWIFSHKSKNKNRTSVLLIVVIFFQSSLRAYTMDAMIFVFIFFILFMINVTFPYLFPWIWFDFFSLCMDARIFVLFFSFYLWLMSHFPICSRSLVNLIGYFFFYLNKWDFYFAVKTFLAS